MKKTSFIKWTKDDYRALQKATRDFNKRITLLEKYDLVDYKLPSKRNYRDLKSQIMTREQLNQIIIGLNNFQKGKAIDEVVLASGETISRWQMEQIQSLQPQAIAKIEAQIIKEKQQSENRMGYKGISNEKIDRLESTLEALKTYDYKTGEDLKRAIARIEKIGSKDYELRKAQTFRDNFMKTFEAGLSGYEYYDEFKRKLESIKDPRDFYDYISRSEFLMDSFVLYDSKAKALEKASKTNANNGYDYSAYGSNEEAFNNALQDVYNFDIYSKTFIETYELDTKTGKYRQL